MGNHGVQERTVSTKEEAVVNVDKADHVVMKEKTRLNGVVTVKTACEEASTEIFKEQFGGKRMTVEGFVETQDRVSMVG
jgi:hypothetical protein